MHARFVFNRRQRSRKLNRVITDGCAVTLEQHLASFEKHDVLFPALLRLRISKHIGNLAVPGGLLAPLGGVWVPMAAYAPLQAPLGTFG